MGRYSKGIITNGEATRLELSYLMKNGFIKKDYKASGRLSWTNGNDISFESEFTDQKQEIRLNYFIKKNSDAEKIEMDYTIQLKSVLSNLGRGEVWYFICPISGRKARILYLSYGCNIFKCLKSYQNRIYYKNQICSKSFISSEKYFILEDKLKKLYPRLKKTNYQGKETKLNKRIKNLEFKKEYYDYLRWKSFEKMTEKYKMK